MFERYRSELEDKYGSRSNANSSLLQVFEQEVGDEKLHLVTAKQFHRVLTTIGMHNIKYHKENVDSVFMYFDIDDKGLIDYTDFVLTLFPSKEKKNRRHDDDSGAEGGSSTGGKVIDVDDVLDRMKRKLEDSYGKPKREVLSAFKNASKGSNMDRSVVNKRGFRVAMEALGVKVTSEEVHAVFEKYLTIMKGDEDDYVDYEEFTEHLRFAKSGGSSSVDKRESSRK